MVQAEGLEAVFECLYSTEVGGYTWYLDGKSVDPKPTRSPLGVRIGQGSLSLTIQAIPLYHESVVWCEAIVNRMFLPSQNASLEVHMWLVDSTPKKYY